MILFIGTELKLISIILPAATVIATGKEAFLGENLRGKVNRQLKIRMIKTLI